MKEIRIKKKTASPETVQAAEAFIERAHGDWSAQAQAEHEARLKRDDAYAQAFHGVDSSWRSIALHAEAPEIMELRGSAIAWMRQRNMRRWKGASNPWRMQWLIASLAAIAVCVAVQLSPYGYHPNIYSTGIGQQQNLNLDDRSHVALDAATKLQVTYSDTARTVQLFEGQAQFSVAQDPTRPFTVRVGDRTIVALGTVFTVEYVEGKLRVATLEGRVAVREERGNRQTVELGAGEALRIAPGGGVPVKSAADVAVATAWLHGKVIFRDEPLGDAVRRLNRYSRLKLDISDPALAALRISGVFEAGDAGSFARAVEGYYAVVADYADSRTVNLRFK